MSVVGSPLADEGPTRPAKKKIASSRVSILQFADEIMDDAASQEIDPFADCSDHPPVKANHRRSSLTNRRRSSMGGASVVLPEKEQVRIAEMYKTVIQMASENKLTEKNSWNFDLIDHLGRLIRDESKTVNFQKASCTLDASLKIYSNRVDDTYASSHRILESLSRGNQGHDSAEDDDGADNLTEKSRAAKAKVGSKASSARLHLTETIERNVQSLNLTKVEHDVTFDPMFHKLSKAFDEGGARGMLVYNMRLSRRGCSLSFQSPQIEESCRQAELRYHSNASSHAVIDMADLVRRSGITPSAIQSLCISDKLASYYDIVGRPMQELGLARSVDGDRPSSLPVNRQIYRSFDMPVWELPREETGSVDSPVSNGRTTTDNSPSQEMGEAGDGEEVDGPVSPMALSPVREEDVEEDYGGVPPSSPHRPSLFSPLPPLITPAKSRASLDAAGSRPPPAPGATQSDDVMQTLVQNLLNLQIDGSNDYAYLNLLASHPAAAAAMGGETAHWKYGLRGKKPPSAMASTATAGEGQAEVRPAKKAATASVVGKLAFSLKPVDADVFGTSTARSAKRDPTLWTSAAEQKQVAEQARLSLPAQETRITVKDLCRLNTLPHALVPPHSANMHKLVHCLQQQAAQRHQTENTRHLRQEQIRDSVLYSFRHDDHIVGVKETRGEGLLASQPAGEGGSVPFPAEEDYGGEGMDDLGGYDDQGEDYMGRFSVPKDMSGEEARKDKPVLSGLQVDTSKLVQAPRVVGKIHINYAKVSTRVNVAKLKADLWEQIDSHISTSPSATSSQAPTAAASSPPALSFQELLHEAHSDERAETVQKEASLAYYFICLLHLANEKNLKITGQEDMADLTITPGK